MKKFYFDVELIIDYKRDENARGKPFIGTHRIYRGLTTKELKELIKENEPKTSLQDCRITMNIRGVTY